MLFYWYHFLFFTSEAANFINSTVFFSIPFSSIMPANGSFYELAPLLIPTFRPRSCSLSGNGIVSKYNKKYAAKIRDDIRLLVIVFEMLSEKSIFCCDFLISRQKRLFRQPLNEIINKIPFWKATIFLARKIIRQFFQQ